MVFNKYFESRNPSVVPHSLLLLPSPINSHQISTSHHKYQHHLENKTRPTRHMSPPSPTDTNLLPQTTQPKNLSSENRHCPQNPTPRNDTTYFTARSLRNGEIMSVSDAVPVRHDVIYGAFRLRDVKCMTPVCGVGFWGRRRLSVVTTVQRSHAGPRSDLQRTEGRPATHKQQGLVGPTRARFATGLSVELRATAREVFSTSE